MVPHLTTLHAFIAYAQIAIGLKTVELKLITCHRLMLFV